MNNELLIDKNRLVKTLIDNTPIAYIIMDDTNRIHYVNESFLKLRGLDRDKTIGEICYNISNGGKHCKFCAISSALEKGSKTMLQRKDLLPNGTVRYIDDYAIPLFHDVSSGRSYLLEIMVNRSEEMSILNKCNRDLEYLIKTLVLILEAKDSYTAMHSEHVQKYATKLALALDLPDNEVLHISLAALLHDIGKLKIPLEILHKPAKLTDDEFNIIKTHPEIACDILDGLVELNDICQMVRHHHERLDGKGYPDGLDDKQLDLGSRILAVADTYDAMTTDRPYRKALSREQAILELKRSTGTQLDANVVDIFSTLSDDTLSSDEIVDRKSSLLIRELTDDSVSDIHQELVIEIDEMNEKMDTDKLLNAIFENTPCGYVLTSDDNTVIFSNNFALNYLGYSKEVFIGSKCELFLETSLDVKRADCSRMRRKTPSGNCVFDLYHINLSENNCHYNLYVFIDRTQENQIRARLQNSYIKLISILHELTKNEMADIDNITRKKLDDIKCETKSLAQRYAADTL